MCILLSPARMDQVQNVLQQFISNLEMIKKEELIEEVAAHNPHQKEALKFTDSFIYETPSQKQKPAQNIQLGLNNAVKMVNNQAVHLGVPQQQQKNIIHPSYQPSGQPYQLKMLQQPYANQALGNIRLGANYFCPKKHHLHFQLESPNFVCSKCGKGATKLSWSCKSCNYYQCVSCKTYPRYQCPYNDVLRASGSVGIDLTNRMCDVCEGHMLPNGVTCPSCNYDLCNSCFRA